MTPSWITPLRELAALLAAWGVWIAVVTRTDLSIAYGTISALADIRIQGAIITTIGALALWLTWRPSRLWVISGALVSAGWTWVWFTLMAGSWTSTATLVYGAIVLKAGAISWHAWGEWVETREVLRGRRTE